MFEIKETEKIVIAKPIASRPGVSNVRSFSQVISSAVNTSPPAALSENQVAVIRPRTVRFKPTCNSDLVGAEELESGASLPCNEIKESKVKSNVVYKPIAKLVSKTTIAFLANLGGHGISPAREITEVATPIQPPDQASPQTDLTSHIHHDFPVQSEKKSNATLENSVDDNKLPPTNGDRPSNDGHSWRKYGQKQVKGSEYPRSYYKCTYPNCPVKKKVEKTFDGQIAEIVYKGDHNHSKPQPLNCDAIRNEVKPPSCTNQNSDRGVVDLEGRSENQNNIESSLSVAARPNNYQLTAEKCHASVSTSNSSLGLSRDCEEVSEALEAEGDELNTKRTKRENQLLKESTAGGASFEPRIVVQNNADADVKGDGFRWRKYGQKVVKGKIYPRSYYRCTSPKCDVRKYVERMSEDPSTFITTYEGRHNHGTPIKSTKTETSKTRTKKNKS